MITATRVVNAKRVFNNPDFVFIAMFHRWCRQATCCQDVAAMFLPSGILHNFLNRLYDTVLSIFYSVCLFHKTVSSGKPGTICIVFQRSSLSLFDISNYIPVCFNFTLIFVCTCTKTSTLEPNIINPSSSHCCTKSPSFRLQIIRLATIPAI